jgi:hypothetical protein
MPVLIVTVRWTTNYIVRTLPATMPLIIEGHVHGPFFGTPIEGILVIDELEVGNVASSLLNMKRIAVIQAKKFLQQYPYVRD